MLWGFLTRMLVHDARMCDLVFPVSPGWCHTWEGGEERRWREACEGESFIIYKNMGTNFTVQIPQLLQWSSALHNQNDFSFHVIFQRYLYYWLNFYSRWEDYEYYRKVGLSRDQCSFSLMLFISDIYFCSVRKMYSLRAKKIDKKKKGQTPQMYCPCCRY